MARVRLCITFAAMLVAFNLFNSLTISGVFADTTAVDTNAANANAANANAVNATAVKQTLPPQVLKARAKAIRKSYWLACQLAAYEWLDKVAEADPSIIAAICSRAEPARILALHPHLVAIAHVDHYLCRRLCRWRRAADALVRSPYADKIIELDPQGFIMAMDHDPVLARIIAGHRQFNELIYNDPELGKQIAEHIR